MTYEPNPYDPEQPAGEMPAPHRSRIGRLPKAALTGGLALGLALGGAGIGFAASSGTTTPSSTPSNSKQPSTNAPEQKDHGYGKFHGFGGLGGFGAFKHGRVVHGQVTVQTPNGYKTLLIQTGQASNVSSTSITVTSSDGYVHTYVVDPSTVVNSQRDGIGSVAAKDQVAIVATQTNGHDTAVNITDITKIQSSRTGFGFEKPANGSGQNGTGTSGFPAGPGPGFGPGPAAAGLD